MRFTILSFVFAALVVLPASAQSTLGLEPGDHRLQNDDLGVILWGPDTAPTLSIGKSDIWDRRLPKEQPVITMDEITKRALAGDKSILNGAAYYTAYSHYDFPCPKPAGQLIVRVPFVEGGGALHVEKANGASTLTAEHGAKKLRLRIFVSATRNVIVMEGEAAGLSPGDVSFRLWRHQDTIVPGGELHPTLGSEKNSPTDFEPLAAPRAGNDDGVAWVAQDFPGELTFSEGFQSVLALRVEGAPSTVALQENTAGLGTPMVAEKEGRLDHGTFKRFTPINQSPGAAATLTPSQLDGVFTAYATVATTQDSPNALGYARKTLKECAYEGADALWVEHAAKLAEYEQRPRARAWSADGRLSIDQAWGGVPYTVRPAGYYGDVALCSVDSTKFCFQDSGRWHADFHFNEIDATGPCTLRQFDSLAPYYDMIFTMLPMAQANARAVYGCDGAMYPLVHYPLKAETVIHTHMTWEQSVEITALLARPFWLRYRYTGDRDFLRDRVWPVLREGARFYAEYLKLEEDGLYHVFPTVSPEHRGITANLEFNKDSQSGITLIRYHLRAAAEAAGLLGENGEEPARWRAIAEKMPPYPTIDTPDGSIFTDVAGAPPMEFNIAVPLTSVFWGDDIGLDSPPDQIELAKRTLEKINVWQPHQGYLTTVRRRLGIYKPEDGLGIDNVLQSHTGVIRVFPTVPDDFEGGFENLGAQGAFVVSATRTKSGVERVTVQSLVGNTCRLANPWPGKDAKVICVETGGEVGVEGDGVYVVFSTEKGMTYTLGA
ncbi:MAG: hypothetical protein JNK74_24285 [Candidatus Hydrogenedentes bacterium]|nr:hypothetical protein [Candidatus Hydrogenedentota bacterium]